MLGGGGMEKGNGKGQKLRCKSNKILAFQYQTRYKKILKKKAISDEESSEIFNRKLKIYQLWVEWSENEE